MTKDDDYLYSFLKWDKETNSGKVLKTILDPESSALYYNIGGVYYLNENTLFYPKDADDNHRLDDEYGVFDIWYIGEMRHYVENTKQVMVKYDVCFHQDGYEYLGEDNDSLDSLQGPVRFPPNADKVKLRIGHQVVLNNYLKATVIKITEHPNKTKHYAIRIDDNPYFENIEIIIDDYGNAKPPKTVKDHHDGYALGWFNYLNMYTKSQEDT